MLFRKLIAVFIVAFVLTPVPVYASRYDGRDDCGGYSYDHSCRHSSGDKDNRDDNRRAGISPGPFDRSPVDIRDNNITVCFPFSTCGKKDDGKNGDQQPGETPMAGPDLMCIIRSLPFHCDPKPE